MDKCALAPEYVKPRNVGLMFFSMNPEKYIPYAQIDVVQFPDGAGGDRIVERIFRGPLHQQLRDALLYIRNNVLEERIFKRPDRAEADRFFNWPYIAIEESLANAVYHKGYDVREPIEVRVDGDAIEIVSFPGPDRSVTLEGLRTYHVTNRHYRASPHRGPQHRLPGDPPRSGSERLPAARVRDRRGPQLLHHASVSTSGV